VSAGAPKVAYRETIEGVALDVEGKVSKQNGGNGQYARVVLKVERFDGAFAFDNAIKGGVIPSAFIPAVEKGVRQAMAQGPLGFPVTGVKVTLVDGDFHAVDSNDMAFTVAARDGTLAGLQRATSQLLEPVMAVTVDAPSANAGDVIGDLQRRGGRVLGIEEHSGRVEVLAEVPLARLFGHTGSLRSLSQGRAFASAVYARHAPCQA
jgi:elongation factor G